MVDAAKAFAKEPPRRPLTDLEAIVEDFQWRYVDRKKTDQVIKYCAEADRFQLAVTRAVEARDANGKHHNHQSKVDIAARRLFGRRIIRLAMRGSIPLGDFDELHDRLDEVKPYGIGPVTVYDVAVRIGAFLGVEPQSVYMHAGVRQGYMALWNALMGQATEDDLNVWRMERYVRSARIPMDIFPPPLNAMRADDVEDILCTYRGVFETW
jgi:hypothetical protein